MKLTEFKATYRCEEVRFDPRKGWPTGPDLFYVCPDCLDVLPATPADSTQCSCKGIMIDIDYGRFRARNEGGVVLLRRRDTNI